MPQNALFITSLLGLLQITKAFELHRSQGSYLINASRGTVVDLKALARALNRGHIAGAAVDVFEKEPEKNGPGFQHPLQGCPNTILTPHIGGSTVEAQVFQASSIPKPQLSQLLTSGWFFAHRRRTLVRRSQLRLSSL